MRVRNPLRLALAAATCAGAVALAASGARAATPPDRTGGALPQTGVPLAQVLTDAPQLAGALVWPQGTSAPGAPPAPHASAAATSTITSKTPSNTTSKTISNTTSKTTMLAAAARAGTQVGSIVQVRPGAEVIVHSSPGGPVIEALGSRSDSGDQERAFTVYAVDGARWLGVSVPALGGHLGWIVADPTRLVLEPAAYEIRVSLAARELTLLRDGHALLHTPVVIGAPATPTPPGQFSVDDKLNFATPSPEYGIGVLALSVPPPGRNWREWRVAIHGLNNLGQLGGTGSLGCVHVPTSVLQTLLSRVPVGTPVDIQA